MKSAKTMGVDRGLPPFQPLELDFELTLLHALDERLPLVASEEEGFLPRVLGVPHRHTPGGDGDRHAPQQRLSCALGGFHEVLILHGETKLSHMFLTSFPC